MRDWGGGQDVCVGSQPVSTPERQRVSYGTTNTTTYGTIPDDAIRSPARCSRSSRRLRCDEQANRSNPGTRRGEGKTWHHYARERQHLSHSRQADRLANESDWSRRE